jgi:hypothetical protein
VQTNADVIDAMRWTAVNSNKWKEKSESGNWKATHECGEQVHNRREGSSNGKERKETAAAADPSRHGANSTRLSLTWQTPAMHNKFLVSIGRHSYVSPT